MASPAATNIKIENFVIFLLFFLAATALRSHNSWRQCLPPQPTPLSAPHCRCGYMNPYLCPLLGNNMHECAIFAVGTWHRSRGSGTSSGSGSGSSAVSQLELVQGSLRASCGKFSTGKNGSKAAAALTRKLSWGEQREGRKREGGQENWKQRASCGHFSCFLSKHL